MPTGWPSPPVLQPGAAPNRKHGAVSAAIDRGKLQRAIQNMLGYNIIEPSFMGYVDGVHPRKLIDRSYQGRKYRSQLPVTGYASRTQLCHLYHQ